ncbi:MAG: endonuclease/exonuclease/phosphatase family protein, partial [Pseudomonadota bacterium]
MRIMTFNIRFENDEDGPNSWVYRREPVARLIERYAPSILGTQEGRWNQLLYLQDGLPEYHLHAPNRVVDDTCQYATLYFRKRDCDVRQGVELWLSKTPGVHRSKDWGSAFPRMMSYAQIRFRNADTSLWVAVTHLDHLGTEARYQQAKILAEWVAKRTGPAMLIGDFNDGPGSRVHQVLMAPETGLRDTWQILGRREDPRSYTHHGFKGIPQKT